MPRIIHAPRASVSLLVLLTAWLSAAAARAAPAPQEPDGFPPVPPPPPVLFPSQEGEQPSRPFAGVHQGRPFLRAPGDDFRLYPGGLFETDWRSSFGPGVSDVPAGSFLVPYLVVRRARLELSGELGQSFAFVAGLELGGERMGEGAAAGSRFAPADASRGRVQPAEVSASYLLRPWLSFTVGQVNAPFSLENRTPERARSMFERNLAIAGLAVPDDKELGALVWGELFGPRTLAYELGVFSGGGRSRPAVDAWPDFVGRVFSRPLAPTGDSTFRRFAQIGLSARYGGRDQDLVDYDYSAIATGQGFVLWQPAYADSYGRPVRVLPSGRQRAIGGELRLPVDIPGTGRVLDLRAEAYYVANQTREAVAGYELSHTERFGRFKGIGWYGLVSFWPWGEGLPAEEPGVTRPVHLDLDRPAPPLRRGLELLAIAAGINANYSGATRLGSRADANTPDANVAVYQLGGAVQYWHGSNLRAGIGYSLYVVPEAGEPRANQALVPGSLVADAAGNPGAGSTLHELTGRVAVGF
ncbi:MAG: hypothetical protein HY744_16965 [Deltaproteobacteria bacterium]|nr:hypothetical protein [Deltaproteobacteria bacterium]